MSHPAIVLASQSAARRALLKGAGVAFEAMSAAIDEDAVKADLEAHGLDPKAMALALAQAKAVETSRVTSRLVIGADQTLDLDGRLIGKAADIGAARERLLSLRGRRHQLHSATAAALGVLTPMPCVPVIPAPWVPGTPTVTIANFPALDTNCKLMCAWAGVITVNQPAQMTVTVP